MSEDMDRLAAYVVAERKKRRWTQEELAAKAQVSLGVVSNFERRKSNPQAANLRSILHQLDLEDEAGDAQASRTRSEWPADVKTFLDMMGLYLTALREDEREQVIYDVTRQIVSFR